MDTGERRLVFASYWNGKLAGEWLNWVVVFAIASIWLLAFHVVMQGFSAMQDSNDAISTGPGTIASPLPSTAVFTTPGMADATSPAALGAYFGEQLWTDDFDAKYAEDGWLSIG
jgi:hypothetical protein